MSRKTRHNHVNHERWLVSYADFITLLFAFFVVMFASSRQDHTKVKQVESSIRQAFQSMGVFPSDSHQPNLSSATLVPPESVAMVTLGDDVTSLPGVMEDLNNMIRVAFGDDDDDAPAIDPKARPGDSGPGSTPPIPSTGP